MYDLMCTPSISVFSDFSHLARPRQRARLEFVNFKAYLLSPNGRGGD
jgi:hypothetical protein